MCSTHRCARMKPPWPPVDMHNKCQQRGNSPLTSSAVHPPTPDFRFGAPVFLQETGRRVDDVAGLARMLVDLLTLSATHTSAPMHGRQAAEGLRRRR